MPQIVSISLDPQVLKDAQARAKRLGYRSFSAYCEKVFRSDLDLGEAHVLREPSALNDAPNPAAAANASAKRVAHAVSYRSRRPSPRGR